jgi:hypothetical protein
MKKRSVQLVLVACLLVVSVLLVPGSSVAADLSFLSYENQEMIAFDLPFKQFIASYKGKFMEKEKGLKSLATAIGKLEALTAKAKNQGADAKVLGRLGAIKGWLIQAQGLAMQGRLDESKELSIPIRSEIYELHRSLNMLTAEDYMIFFHNGAMHRAEPLIEGGRYMELQMMIPIIEGTVAKFKTPPKGATNTDQYKKRYGILVKKVKAYTTAIKELNEYVDPEYGAYMLSTKIAALHLAAHKKFGALYLSFPKGMVWPKGPGPQKK